MLRNAGGAKGNYYERWHYFAGLLPDLGRQCSFPLPKALPGQRRWKANSELASPRFGAERPGDTDGFNACPKMRACVRAV